MRRNLSNYRLNRKLAALVAILTVTVPVLADNSPLRLLNASESPVIKDQSGFALSLEKDNSDLSKYDSIYFKLHNNGKSVVTVWVKAENPAAQGVTDTVRTAITLEPGQTGTARLRLMRRPQDPGYDSFKPFLMYFKSINVRDNTIDPSQIAKLSIWIEQPQPDQSVAIELITADGQGVSGPVPFLPFVDQYGQYKHTDWPDKIYTDADFERIKKKDEAEMAAHSGPPDWDKWGGWKDGPKQKASGYFYTTKLDGKWWLVTPDGTLFWSYGATGVGAGGEGSPVTLKESWFEELPAYDGPAGKYWGEGKGARYMRYQDGSAWKSFSFSGLNAERKYGPNWLEATADALHARLRNWGLNTMANWSDPVVYLKHKTPYTATLTSGPWSLDHFPDVFDPQWEESMNKSIESQKETTANDPWNIGYYVDNELVWGSGPRAQRAAQGALKAAAGSPTKKVFINDLKDKYKQIADLNAAWGSKFVSWDQLIESRALADPQNDQFKKDCGDMGMKMAEKYFSTVRDSLKRVAPNNLYLGCRFNGYIPNEVVQVAAKYCDVIGYNIYALPNTVLNQYNGVVDKPFIVGEFGITSDLGQMPWRGKIITEDQGARLKPMEDWLYQGFVHPALVGAHFFQFRDQPLTGRPDGEATLRGFINVADTPHFDLVEFNRRMAAQMYQTRFGVKK